METSGAKAIDPRSVLSCLSAEELSDRWHKNLSGTETVVSPYVHIQDVSMLLGKGSKGRSRGQQSVTRARLVYLPALRRRSYCGCSGNRGNILTRCLDEQEGLDERLQTAHNRRPDKQGSGIRGGQWQPESKIRVVHFDQVSGCACFGITENSRSQVEGAHSAVAIVAPPSFCSLQVCRACPSKLQRSSC